MRQLGEVRRGFWALLLAAVLLAMVGPTITLWHAASSALAVRACIWPPAPQAQSSARVFVDILDSADRTALQGPWGQVAVEWDMVTMSMGRQRTDVPGHAGGQGLFAIPLTLAMAGPWWVHVSVSTPGRPVWETHLRIKVVPAIAMHSDPPVGGVFVATSRC